MSELQGLVHIHSRCCHNYILHVNRYSTVKALIKVLQDPPIISEELKLNLLCHTCFAQEAKTHPKSFGLLTKAANREGLKNYFALTLPNVKLHDRIKILPEAQRTIIDWGFMLAGSHD